MEQRIKLRSTRFGRRARRFFGGVAVVLALAWGAHALWNPGLSIRDGRDNRAHNALWLGHGWLGADSWFKAGDGAEKTRFRAPRNIAALAQNCRENGVRDLFPHLTPTQNDGSIAACDDAQVERFLDQTSGLRVLPWIGGRNGVHIVPNDPIKTARFVASVAALLRRHPRLAGVHLNVEPWQDGDAAMLTLLEQLKAALPPGKILSVAAYTPNVGLNPFKMTWSQSYTRKVAARCDQMAWMLYDSSIHDPKLYQWFYARWTRTILRWTSAPNAPEILLGVPTYGAAGPKLGPVYHDPRVENLANALAGLHRGLSDYGPPPPNYAGAALYCEWETDAAEWQIWREEFAGGR